MRCHGSHTVKQHWRVEELRREAKVKGFSLGLAVLGGTGPAVG